jgi:hypothetical protein
MLGMKKIISSAPVRGPWALLAAAAAFFLSSDPAGAARSWQAPPLIRGQDCIAVDRYRTESVVTEFHERMEPEVLVELIEEHQTLVLVVDIRQCEQNVRSVSRWIMAGDRGNGSIQKAYSRQSAFMVVGKETVMVDAEAPREPLPSIQDDYSRWVKKLKTLPTCFPGGSSQFA